MANIKSSKKHIIISEKRRKNNASKKSMIKTFIKRVLGAIKLGNQKKAREEFLIMQPIIDRFSNKGIIHKNKAARHKSILNEKIKKMI